MSTFKILFYLRKNYLNKNKQAGIMVRITLNGEITQFSSKLEADPGFCSLKTHLQQDLNKLLDIMKNLERGFTLEEMGRLVYNRNVNRSQQLKGIFPEHPTFIVVGAGHLRGSKGLIELLRQQGIGSYTCSINCGFTNG